MSPNTKLPPSYIIIPLIGVIPTLTIIIINGLTENYSQLKVLGNTANFLLSLINQISEFSFFIFFHFWMIYLSKTRKVLIYITNAIFINIYACIFIMTLLKFDNQVNLMQFTNPSSFLLWGRKISVKLDYFTIPVYSITTHHQKDKSKAYRNYVNSSKPKYFDVERYISIFLSVIIIIVSLIYRKIIFKGSFIGNFVYPLVKTYIYPKILKKKMLLNNNNDGKFYISNIDIFGEPNKNNSEITEKYDNVNADSPKDESKSEEETKEEAKEEALENKINIQNQENPNNKANVNENENKQNDNIKSINDKDENIHSSSEQQLDFQNTTNTNQNTITITKFTKIYLIILLLLIVYHFIYFFYVLFTTKDLKSAEYSRLTFLESCFISFNHYEKTLSKETQTNFLSYIRNYLPPGRKWLDTNPNPTYPAMHASMEAYCAYNPKDNECLNYIPPEQTPLVKQLPNVLFISYESFNPGYYLIDDDFITEHASLKENETSRYITDKKYYSKTIMPKFHGIEDYAVTFSGMSCFGTPTASAYHALMTGLSPSQSFYNILEGSFLHADDLPSMMRDYGYRSFLISAARLNTDSCSLWIYRCPAEDEAKHKLKCREGLGDVANDTFHTLLKGEDEIQKLKNCSASEINKMTEKLKSQRINFPKWYDYALHYTVNKNNSKYFDIDPDTILINKTNWAADRISTKQLIYHWKQQKYIMKSQNISKPVFASLMTMDSHYDFFGYDNDNQYDYEITEEMKKDVGEWAKHRFIRVNKYADKHVGGLLEWVKENEPNTIFVLTGDHGVRKIPVNKGNDQVVNDVIYSSDCVHGSSGSDNFFVVSGMIGYFGDDPVIKEVMNFDKVKGKTLKIPTDHSDLVYTLEDVLTKLNGTSMQPTHRRSRNLLNLTSDLVDHISNGTLKEGLNEIEKSGWTSYSYNHYNIDYREGLNLLRTHPADVDGSHLYMKASYPQCLVKKNEQPHSLGSEDAKVAFKRMEGKIASENYLNYHNQMYNYAFRDNECIKNRNCTIQEPIDGLGLLDLRLSLYASWRFIFTLGKTILVIEGIALVICLGKVVIEVIRWNCEKCYKKISKVTAMK